MKIENFEKAKEIKEKIDALQEQLEQVKIAISQNKKPSGENFEVVNFISLNYERDPVTSKVAELYERYGTGYMYELARELTDEFELLNKGRQWDGEFFEEIESFLMQKI